MVRSEAERLGRLVNDLLDLNIAETGRTRLRQEDVTAESLGAVLHECLSGRMTFQGDSGRSRMFSVLTQEPEPLDVGADLQAVVSRALARDPASRYPGAREFLTDLRQVQAGESVVQLPRTLALLDFENLEAHLRGWKELRPDEYQDLIRHPAVGAFAKKKGL